MRYSTLTPLLAAIPAALAAPPMPEFANTTEVPKHFGILLFPHFQALDAFGPLDVLNTLAMLYKSNTMHLSVISKSLDPVFTAMEPTERSMKMNMTHNAFGQKIVPTHTMADVLANGGMCLEGSEGHQAHGGDGHVVPPQKRHGGEDHLMPGGESMPGHHHGSEGEHQMPGHHHGAENDNHIMASGQNMAGHHHGAPVNRRHTGHQEADSHLMVGGQTMPGHHHGDGSQGHVMADGNIMPGHHHAPAVNKRHEGHDHGTPAAPASSVAAVPGAPAAPSAVPAPGTPAPPASMPSHDDKGPIEVLIVPGGGGTREPMTEEIDFIKQMYPKVKYIISVCTGASILARAGVLDGKKATTNKRAWEWATSTGPNTEWVPEARWVEDGNIFTSSGISAGIDVTYAWIAKVYGEDVADYVAQSSEYERWTEADSDPFAQIWDVIPADDAEEAALDEPAPQGPAVPQGYGSQYGSGY